MLTVSLCSCGDKKQTEPVTLFPEGSETVNAKEEAPSVRVNDTYDKVLFEMTGQDTSEKVEVLDDSMDYRTTDSYRHEKAATDEAVRLFYEEMQKYSDITIDSVSVFDCMDDGEAVYYSFSIRHTYTVESGGSISNTYYCDVGIEKSDETAFDPSERLDEVREGYSVFKKRTEKNSVVQVTCDGDEESKKEAMKTFVRDRLKKAETSQIFSVTEIDEGMYEIICSGENSYGLIIKDSAEIKAEYSEENGILILSW